MEYPLVSIIIPAKPGESVSAIECLKRLDYPEDRLEIFVSEGTQPARQRNAAARVASGDILYFLDDDSCTAPDVLQRIVMHFKDEKVAVVGGPSITPDKDTPLQTAFGAALGSLFGGFSIRNRYRRVGGARESSENELILCNLAFRKSPFIEEGGLNERLYPNEENELMNRLQKKGYKLIHDPDIFVLRSQRKTLGAFMKQMLNYGRGRGEQTIMDGQSFKPSHLAPSMFLLYLLSIALFSAHLLYLLPAACYFVISLISSISNCWKEREWRFLLILPPLYLIMHVCYGAGFIWGFWRGINGGKMMPSSEVAIRQVKRSKEILG